MGIMQVIGVSFMPFFCAGLVLNNISLAKKIKKGEENTARNTFWAILFLTLIVYSIISFVMY